MSIESNIVALEHATRVFSSPDMIAELVPYRHLVEQGDAAVGVLLAALPKSAAPVALIMLLGDITHENPVKDSDRGRISNMVEAWVEWGKTRSKQSE